MSDDKHKVTDKASEIARNIWLAGVGAYGRAVEEAQGRLEKAMEPPKLFRDLVKIGTALEEDARETTVAARNSVEERINRVRENFHNQRPARIEDLIALNRKIDQLTRKVDRLNKALEEFESGSKSRNRRKTTGKATAARAGAARNTSASAASGKPANKKSRREKAPSRRKKAARARKA